MMGQRFAEHLTGYLQGRGIAASSCGVIQSNPERSKHLETATLSILGQFIDFVNLRAETYASHSRIPDAVAFGTPAEDALRRDITINAMFWNIHTEEVEDFTGRGLEDLQHGLIRTPLGPKATLLDDPLRLLRVIRFSTRFQFAIVPELLEAMRDGEVLWHLREKVSRERIGIEVDKILGDRHAMQGLLLMNDVGVFASIFGPVREAQQGGAGADGDGTGRLEVFRLLMTLSQLVYFEPAWSAEQRKLGLLAGSLLPYAGQTHRVAGKGGRAGKEEHVVTAIVRDALKYSNREVGQVGQLLHHVARVEALLGEGAAGADPVRLGRLLRDLGANWRLALHLGAVRQHWQGTRAHEALDQGAHEGALQAQHGRLRAVLGAVEALQLGDAWQWRPLLSGREVQALLGVPPGPALGGALEALLDWQYGHPGADAAAARTWVRGQRPIK